MSKQLNMFINKGHGGARTGAGRPKNTEKNFVSHSKRESFNRHHPLHITLKVCKDIPRLRSKKLFRFISKAIKTARQKDLRVIHFCVQSNHLHLLVEANNEKELARSMQSFCTSLARLVNNHLKRKGKVFLYRYHIHILKSLREVRNTLIYIFKNYSKHSKRKNIFDHYSSFACLKYSIKLNLEELVRAGPDPNTLAKLQEHYGELISPPTSWKLQRFI